MNCLHFLLYDDLLQYNDGCFLVCTANRSVPIAAGIKALSYQVLARKWRPQTFSEMVEQTHVLKALINALDQDRLHHAYLFTGTRGVGKTTIARLFAKALNCEQGISSTPCGQCSACLEIREGRFVDLIEVDAASRTKVEDTRELLDNVQYTPTRGRFKVYLIDEVHMLSTHSFNALLKTLEEPPPHVKFLLATTDPQKLPPTILSRCLQFNLRRMPISAITDHLEHILTTENISFEAKALEFIAHAADGSMRDALSLLDQAIAYSQSELQSQKVADMLGFVARDHLQNIVQALANQDAQALMQVAQQLEHQNAHFEQVLSDLLDLLHHLAVFKAVPDAQLNTLDGMHTLEVLADQLTAEDIQLYYQIALLCQRDMAYSEPRRGFEMALLRMLSFRPQVSQGQSVDVQAGSSQTGSNQTESNQARSENGSNQAESSRSRVDQAETGQSIADEAQPDEARPDEARPDEARPSPNQQLASDPALFVGTRSEPQAAFAQSVQPDNAPDRASRAAPQEQPPGQSESSSPDAALSASQGSKNQTSGSAASAATSALPDSTPSKRPSKADLLKTLNAKPTVKRPREAQMDSPPAVTADAQSVSNSPVNRSESMALADNNTAAKPVVTSQQQATEGATARQLNPMDEYEAMMAAADQAEPVMASDKRLDERSEQNDPAVSQDHKTVEQPSAVAPVNNAGDNWADILARLNLSGMTAALAQHVTLHSVSEREWIFHIAQANAQLINDTQQQRLQQAISQYLNAAVVLRFEVVDRLETTLAVSKALQDEVTYQQAVEDMRNDPVLQKIVKEFNATVLEDKLQLIDKD